MALNNENVVNQKSYAFSVRIVNLCRYLRQEKRELVLSKQLLRSGTSIGANLWEARYAQSTADFISKLTISLKEASETSYWLSLLFDTGYLTKKEYISIADDCDELLKLLTSIIKSIKDKSYSLRQT